jgi:serine/threonine protein kinase
MLLFNRYEYHPQADLLGKGELSRVYRAIDTTISLPVAVKIYRSSDPAETKAPVGDSERMMSFQHPNLCRYLHIAEVEREDSFGEKEKMQICIQELVDAGNFTSYYRDHASPEIMNKLLRNILQGLSYLHDRGIIHRRIKPSNLLVREQPDGPVIQITDFGIGMAKAAVQDGNFSALVVSVPYMAPEQFNPRKYGIDGKISANIDYWSLGLTVYEAISGEVLFKGGPEDSREQVIQHILSPELPAGVRQLPSPYAEFVARCLVKDARHRAQSAEELLAILAIPASDPLPLPDTTVDTAADDDTQILVLRPGWSPEEKMAEDNEDTRVLPAAARQIAETPDDTQVLASPAKPAAGDDTQVLPRTPAPSTAPPVPIATPPPAPPQPASPAYTSAPAASLTPKGEKEEHISLFNRYEYNPKTGLIGKGGFSRVYKAFDRKLNRWVALKIYKTGEFSERYSPIAEIRRVVNLDHPNICRYLDIEEIEKENAFGEKEITQICVMELLDGGNLSEYYAAHHSDELLKKLINDVLNGLAYLHKNGIIHRDIKPANILIKETIEGPVAKITDFGISKQSDSVNNHSSSALVVSIPYMAPEQLNVRKYGIQEKISYNLDLWSLGVTIFEVITGKILFKNSEQDSSEQIMTNIMAPELPEKIRELPQPFLDIVIHCIIKDARERAQKAEELIVLLHRNPPERRVDIPPVAVTDSQTVRTTGALERRFSVAMEDEPVEKKSTVPRERRVISHERWVGYLKIAVGAAAVLLGIALFIYFRNHSEKEQLAIPTTRADSVSIVSNVPTAAPVSSPPAPNAAATQQPVTNAQHTTAVQRTATGDEGATTSPNAPDKKSHRNTETNSNKQPSGTNAQKYLLLLTTTQTCQVSINRFDYGVLESGKTLRARLPPGDYVIQAVSVVNKSVTYTGKLTVSEGQMNQVGDFRIPL